VNTQGISKQTEDLTRYITRCLKANSPLLIFLEYQNQNTKTQLTTNLESLLKGLCNLVVLDLESVDQHQRLFQHMSENEGFETLFVVDSYPKEEKEGGQRISSDFLSYLNVNRDRVSENRFKVLFFLRSVDVPFLMEEAGDLWAHRHRFFVLKEDDKPSELITSEPGTSVSFEPGDWGLSREDNEKFETLHANTENLLKETQSLTDRLTLLDGLSQFLLDRHAYTQAISILDQQREEFSSANIDDPNRYLTILYELSESYRKTQHYHDSLKYCEEGLKIAQKIEALKEEGVFLICISQVYGPLGRREEALESSLKAVEIYERLSQKNADVFEPDLATSLGNLGIMYRDLGRREEALEWCLKAVEIRERLSQRNADAFEPDLAMSLGALGAIHLANNDLEQALESLVHGIKCLTRLFLISPLAFAPLMQNLISVYSITCEEAGVELSAKMLAPVEQKLQELKGDSEAERF